MSTKTLHADDLREAAYDADLEPEEAIMNDYSGRAMYGDTCLGIVADSEAKVVEVLFRYASRVAWRADDAETVAESLDDMASLVSGMRTDSMGLSMIAYFPGVGLREPR